MDFSFSSESDSTNANTNNVNINESVQNISESNSELNESFAESSTNLNDFNKESFKLTDEKQSSIYILKEGLFTRILLPIKPGKDREMRVNCTR
jgi:methyl-accepting chemotaxis protein